MRSPRGDHRGSAHCVSGWTRVSGVTTPPTVTRTNRFVVGAPCTATMAPSSRTSGSPRRALRVRRRCRPPWSSHKSLRMCQGLVNSSCANSKPPSGNGTLTSEPFRRASRRTLPAVSTAYTAGTSFPGTAANTRALSLDQRGVSASRPSRVRSRHPSIGSGEAPATDCASVSRHSRNASPNEIPNAPFEARPRKKGMGKREVRSTKRGTVSAPRVRAR
jgi:hypothetical protein